MWDVIILGGGPAGLSCALLLGRCCRRVLVVDASAPRNARTPAVSGFLTRDGTSPGELRALARAELAPYDVTVLDDTATAVQGAGTFAASGPRWEVRLALGFEVSRTLVLATGIRDAVPAIQGVGPFWGTSVVTCPYCDAWERRGQPLAVYGWDADAAEAALGLRTWSDDVALLTDGRAAPEEPRLARHGVAVRVSPILRLEGSVELEAIALTDGTRRPCAALFVHAGQRPADPLVAALGCGLEPGGCVTVDREGRTSVPGIWACGDAATGTQLAIVAAAEGARAALSINRALRAEDHP